MLLFLQCWSSQPGAILGPKYTTSDGVLSVFNSDFAYDIYIFDFRSYQIVVDPSLNTRMHLLINCEGLQSC